jgi:HK97 family phage portal protein
VKSLGKTLVRAAQKAAAAPQLPTPVPYSRDMPRMMMYNTAAREKDALLRAVEEDSTLFSITNRTGTAVSELIFRLYRKTPNPDVTSERVEIQSHAILDLLARPNKFMPAAYLKHTLQLHLDATGEGYQIINRSVNQPKALPLELWPVTPSRIEPVPSAKNFMNGWMYTSPDGEQVPLELWEVIPFRTPHPRDPYRGLGPVQPMITQIEASKFASEYNRNFFLNSAQPGGIVTFDHRLQDDEWNEFVQRWNEQHRGISRAHRVAFLENATWVTNQMTMRDMAFAELRTNARDEKYEAFGIAGSVMGVTEDVNRANAEAGKAMFGDLLVNPRGAVIRDTYNLFLVPMYGDATIELDFDSPVPSDQAMENATLVAKSTAAMNFITAGFVAEDVLQTCELPPMRWEKPEQPPAPVIVPPGQQPGDGSGQDDEDDNEDEDEGSGDAPSNLVPLRIHGLRAAHDPASVDLTAADEQWQAALAQLSTQYQADIVPAQRQQLQQQITTACNDGQPDRFAHLTVDSAAAAALLLAAMMQLGQQAAQQASAEAMAQGETGVPAQAPTQAQLEDTATIVAALIATELAVSAGREAARLYRPGMNGQQLADEVGAFLATLSAATVAAHLGGALMAAMTLGRTETFTKISHGNLYASEVNDKNTCAPCRDIDGHLFGPANAPATRMAVDDLYPAGGYSKCLGRERCRGTVIWRPDSSGKGS